MKSRTPSTLLLLSLWNAVRPALFEPAGNQVLFGMWPDTQSGYSDTPSWLNERLGLNVPVYQISQKMPRIPYNYVTGEGGAAPEKLIEESGTDAAVFLTIYPDLSKLVQQDYDDLAQQIADYPNRTVFVRYAPEMQGYWFPLYGQQPTAFIASWKIMYQTIKAKAPNTIIVWAPNTGQGYPYQNGFPAGASAADIALLDTNADGNLDRNDDPYSPYFPGFEFMDWAGLSIYYKGTGDDTANAVQQAGYCAGVWDGTGGVSGNTNFYQTYCAANPNIACMFSESGAAYHRTNPVGDTQFALAKAWIDDCITNIPFLDAHPRIKLIMNFEYEKIETANGGGDDLRDYRLTNDTQILAELKNALSAAGDRFTWAGVRAIPTSLSSPGAAPPMTNSLGETISKLPDIISATMRPRNQEFPVLFGDKSALSGVMREVAQIGVMAGAVVAGFVAVFRFL